MHSVTPSHGTIGQPLRAVRTLGNDVNLTYGQRYDGRPPDDRIPFASPFKHAKRFRYVLVPLMCVVLFPVLAVDLSAVERPNVVVLLADDLGFKDIGCDDGPVKTPALDGLAAAGVRFTDFYSGANVCSPSRATLLTGRQHMRAGVYSWIHDHDQNSHLLEREVTLAEWLKENGYATAHFGKWHLGLPIGKRRKPTPSDHGFDFWFVTGNNAQPSHKNPRNFIRNGQAIGEVEGYACQIVVDEAISWLDMNRGSQKPFFMNVWFHEPHAPIAAPDEIVSNYGDLDDHAAIYSGTIDNTDRAIARLIEKLKQLGQMHNTLIVYSSDNGSYRADRVGNLRGKKGSNYEGGLRVPGIFYWPEKIRQGHTEVEPAGLVDVLPTICGLLGIDPPDGVHLDGSDLTPLLTVAQRSDVQNNSEFKRHQPLFWHKPNSQPAIAMRDGKFSCLAFRDGEMPKDRQKMKRLLEQIEVILKAENNPVLLGAKFETKIFNRKLKNPEAEKLRGQYVMLNMFNESWIPSIKSGTFSRFQLFDLSIDPGQQNDISKLHPEVVERFREQMLKINASVMADAPDWHLPNSLATARSPTGQIPRKPPMSIEEKTKIHRLATNQHSIFDAFVYVNRIPEKPEPNEKVEDYSGRIFGRLANQEGRVLLKLPKGMNRDAYLGFKTFLRNEGEAKVGNCAVCHAPPNFLAAKSQVAPNGNSSTSIASLRNLQLSDTELRKTILNKIHVSETKQSGNAKDGADAYAHMKLKPEDVPELIAFLRLLNDVTDDELREMILNATVLDTSRDIER